MIPLALWGAAPAYEPREPDLTVRVRRADEERPIAPAYVRRASQRAGFARRTLDLTGMTFDDLTALERDEDKLRGYWRCRCVCSRIVSRTSDYLRGQGGAPRRERLKCGRGCPGKTTP